MRLMILIAGLSLAAGAAHAQFQPIQPIRPPQNPYAVPRSPAIPQPRLIGAPEVRTPELFKPYKPYAGVNPDTAPSGLYPEQHPKKRRKQAGSLTGF